jgi:hypothetical protein
MGLGGFLCKIGLHSGAPATADDDSDIIEESQIIDEGQKREVVCTRCGLVYTELVNSINWYHPM